MALGISSPLGSFLHTLTSAVDPVASRVGSAVARGAANVATLGEYQHPGSLSAYGSANLQALDPRTPSGAISLAGLVSGRLTGDTPVLSPYARGPTRVFRTEDLYPGLSFRNGPGELHNAIAYGEGIRQPIEIDWDPTHGLATIIQGNHRLQAAQGLGQPYIPGTIGQMYGDLGRYIAYMKSNPNRKPTDEYGSIKVGTATKALIDRLLSLHEAHPETGGLYSFRPDVSITPEDWSSLVRALGLPNVKVEPGTTIDQARAAFARAGH